MRTHRPPLLMMTLVSLSLLLSCAAGYAQVARITGSVKNVLTNTPIGGAVVSNIALDSSQATDGQGGYSVDAEPDTGRNNIIVWHPAFGCARWKGTIGAGDAALPDLFLCPQVQTRTVSDSFNRPDSASLGSTEDADHLPWLAGDLRSNTTTVGGTLCLPRQAESGDGASIGGGFFPADLDVAVVVQRIEGTGFGAICYRQDPGKGTGGKAQYGFGFAVTMPADGRTVTCGYYWFGSLKAGINYMPPAPIDWNVPHTIRIRAQGYHHQVWLDGREIISYLNGNQRQVGGSNPLKPLGGYVGLYRMPDTGMWVDSINVNVLGADIAAMQSTATALLVQASDPEGGAQAVEAVSRLENIYRAYGLCAEGAQYLKALARAHPSAAVAPRAYIAAGRLLLSELAECGYVVTNGVPAVAEWNEKSKIFGRTDYVSAITDWELVREVENQTLAQGEELIKVASAQMAQRQYAQARANLSKVLSDPTMTSNRSVYESARFLNAVVLFLEGNTTETRTALEQILADPSDMFGYKPLVAKLVARLGSY